MAGRFEGEVQTEWLKHGGTDRQMELLADFKYVDDSGSTWVAPKGHVVDGASIPEMLWTMAGAPFVGDYRRATVLHDVYCDTKSKPHKAVHRMFYEAMLTDGVNGFKAGKMYTAVRLFGPKWPWPPTEFAPKAAAPETAPSIDALEAALDVALGE